MKKRLYRSRQEKMIAGICGGLGEYFDIDPTLIRLAMVAAVFGAGVGFLFYIFAWFIIPINPEHY